MGLCLVIQNVQIEYISVIILLLPSENENLFLLQMYDGGNLSSTYYITQLRNFMCVGRRGEARIQGGPAGPPPSSAKKKRGEKGKGKKRKRKGERERET